jgi:hypothetical protein
MAHHWLPHPVDIVSRQARCAAAINLAGVPRQACLFGESARRLFVYALLRRGFDIFSMRRRLGALSCRQEIESEAREGAMKTITTHYIDGAFVPSNGREIVNTIRPTDGRVIARVTMADEEDTRRAIAAAKSAFLQSPPAAFEP